MKLDQMNAPETREEFERNIFLLKHQVSEGKYVYGGQTSQALESLLRVRQMENGRIDLLSVDEMARLQANQCAHVMQMIENGDIQMQT